MENCDFLEMGKVQDAENLIKPMENYDFWHVKRFFAPVCKKLFWDSAELIIYFLAGNPFGPIC